MSRWAFFFVGLLASPVFGGPVELILAAKADAATLQPEDALQARYLYHLGAAAELKEFAPPLSYHVNELSRGFKPETPLLIEPGLWRVDLRHYQWNPNTWEKLFKVDPYHRERLVIAPGKAARPPPKKSPGRQSKGKGKQKARPKAAPEKAKARDVVASWMPAEEITFLVNATGSNSPIVRADWFFAVSCKQIQLDNSANSGVGYYDWLGVKNRNDFFKLARFRERDAIELQREVRAAVANSGVAWNSRQIVILDGITGKAFTTLDVQSQKKQRDLLVNLRRGDSVHDAEEHYLPLPNGLPAYLLCNDQGELQNSAPEFIGFDKSVLNTGKDGRIHIALACQRCHSKQVLQPISDWTRATFQGDLKLQDPDFRVTAELERQYFSDLEGELVEQRARYAKAFFLACGLGPEKLSEAYALAYHTYADHPLDLDDTARELGATAEKWRAALVHRHDVIKELDPLLAALLKKPPQPMARVLWEERYIPAQKILRGFVE